MRHPNNPPDHHLMGISPAVQMRCKTMVVGNVDPVSKFRCSRHRLERTSALPQSYSLILTKYCIASALPHCLGRPAHSTAALPSPAGGRPGLPPQIPSSPHRQEFAATLCPCRAKGWGLHIPPPCVPEVGRGLEGGHQALPETADSPVSSQWWDPPDQPT